MSIGTEIGTETTAHLGPTQAPLDTGIQGTNWHEQQRCNHASPHRSPRLGHCRTGLRDDVRRLHTDQMLVRAADSAVLRTPTAGG